MLRARALRTAALVWAGLACLQAAPAHARSLTSARVVTAHGYVSLDRVPPGSGFKLAAVVEIRHGYHIHANKPTLDYLIPTALALVREPQPAGLRLGEPVYPQWVEQTFSFSSDGKPLRVYEGKLIIAVDASAARDAAQGTRTVSGTLTVQACDDASCLAPAKIPVEFPVVIAAPGEPINAMHPEIFAALPAAASGGPDGLARDPGAGRIGEWIAELGWGPTLALIFLGGLALNLTPCVYPLIPITLAFFGGQGAGRPGATFRLASVYVLGMCVTYSLLGAIAATTGSVLGSALQSPLALLFVALVMVALALSMFGLYDLQVPLALRRRLGSRPGPGGALFMGLTVGLVAAPCVGPFVVSLLAFVGQAGSLLLGFALFFVLALGLGLPYLVLGSVAGAAGGLPRAGAWMVWVKKLFGCILIAMAFYFANPLLPAALAPWTIPAVLALAALYLAFIEGSPVRGTGFRIARISTAAACVAAAAWLAWPGDSAAGVVWEPFTDEALERARAAGTPVIIDFTADWCLPCKELDHLTFSNPEVVAASHGFVTLKADITSEPTPAVAALRDRLQVMGAPTIIFMDARGNEILDLRLTGFERAAEFLTRMERARAS